MPEQKRGIQITKQGLDLDEANMDLASMTVTVVEDANGSRNRPGDRGVAHVAVRTLPKDALRLSVLRIARKPAFVIARNPAERSPESPHV